MKTRYFLATLILLAGISSCEKTEKVEDFPRHESKLVANCFFRPDTPFMFYLSKSLSPLDNAPFRSMNSTSAYIRVYEDKVLFDSFRIKNNVFIGDPLKIPKINKKYSFDCFYPGFGNVKGEDYLPDSFKVSQARGFNTISRVYNYFDTFKYIEHTSEFDFSLQSSNLFGDYLYLDIELVEKDTAMFPYYYKRYIYPEEVGGRYESETAAGRVFISNEDGKITDIKIKWELQDQYPNGIVKNTYIVTVYSCSKNTFEYIRRSSLQIENEGDPFSQPTPISNNIINGYGIFGGICRQKFKITF